MTDTHFLAIEVRSNGVQQANRQLQELERIGARAERGVQSLSSAAQQFNNIAKTAFGGFSVAATIGKLISVQREFDVLNSSLVTVAGGSANAEREFSWIKEFAATTPYQLTEVTSAFVKLKALGLDATKDALISYGNTASAMGKSLNQFIEAVADASTGEFERLKEFGIKARQDGDTVALTFQGITRTIGNNAQEITRYLNDIGNNQFAGAMAERAKTLDGQLSNLADTWDELFRTINQNNAGTLISDSVGLANGAIKDAITILEAMNGATRDNARDTGAMAAIQSGIATVFETVAVTGLNVKYVLTQVGNELGGLAAQAAAVAKLDFAAAGAIGDMMKEDAEIARREVDAASERILNARKNAIAEMAKAAAQVQPAASQAAAVVNRPSSNRRSTRSPKEDLNAGQDTEAAKAYARAMEAVNASQLAAEKSGLTLNAAQSVLYDLMRSPEWARMPEAWQQSVIAQTAAATATSQVAEAQKRLNDLIADTPTAKLEEQRKTMQFIAQAYLDGKFGAVDSAEAIKAFGEVTNSSLGNVAERAKETSDAMSKFAENFARSTQSTISDLLFNGADKGFKGLVDGFGNTIKRMMADAAAAQLMDKLFGSSFGQTGKVDAGSWISTAASWIGSFFPSANGNAFSGSGAVQAFANGGAFGNGEILTQPTAFRLFANGGAFRMGVAGEAGPEGALPLKRMSNGKLGVYADGGSGPTNIINVTVQGNRAPDVRRAAGQGAREALALMSGARRYE